MPVYVKVGEQYIKFPDGMSKDDMKKALSSYRKPSQTIGLEGQPPAPPMAADMAIDESMPPMTQEVFGQGAQDVSRPLSESEIIRSRDIARESLLSDIKFKEATPEEREAMIDKTVRSQPRIGLGASTFPDAPTVGSMEFNKYLSEELGISPWSGNQMKIAAQSFIANPENVVNTVVEEVSGATKVVDERTGEISVDINGRLFTPSELSKTLGDIAKFSPVGGLATATGRMAGAGTIATVSELFSKYLGGGQKPIDIAKNAGTEVMYQAFGEAGEGAFKYLSEWADVGKDFFSPNYINMKNNLRLRGDDALDKAVQAKEIRDRVQEGLGLPEDTVKLNIYQMTDNPELEQKAYEIFKKGGEGNYKITQAIEKQDKGLHDVLGAFLNRRNIDGAPEPRMQEAISKERDELNKKLQEDADVLFSQVRNAVGEVDVSPILNKLNNIISSETLKGDKGEPISKTLNQLKKYIEPPKMKIKVNVPIKTKEGTIIPPSAKSDTIIENGKTVIVPTKTVSPKDAKLKTKVGGKTVEGYEIDPITGQRIQVDTGRDIAGKTVKGEKVDPVTGKRITTEVERIVGGKKVKGFPVDPVTGKRLTQEEIQEVSTTAYEDIGELHKVYKTIGDMIIDKSDPTKKMTNRERLMIKVHQDIKEVLDKTTDAFGDANKAYKEGRDAIELLDQGIAGDIFKMNPDKLNQVSKKIFDSKYVLGDEIDSAFKRTIEVLRKQDPDGLDDLTTKAFANIVSEPAEEMLIEGGSAAVSKALAKKRKDIKLLKHAYGEGSEQAKLLDDIVSLFEIKGRGRPTSQRHATPTKQPGEAQSIGFWSMKARAMASLVNWSRGVGTQRMNDALSEIMSRPDSQSFKELNKVIKRLKIEGQRKSGDISQPLAQLTRIIDSEQEESE